MVPKNGGFTVIRNERNELIPTRTVIGWRVCIDYRKLNTATRNYHYPLPLIKCWIDWQGILTTVSWMAIQDTIK